MYLVPRCVLACKIYADRAADSPAVDASMLPPTGKDNCCDLNSCTSCRQFLTCSCAFVVGVDGPSYFELPEHSYKNINCICRYCRKTFADTFSKNIFSICICCCKLRR